MSSHLAKIIFCTVGFISACGEVSVCDIRQKDCQNKTFYAVLAERDEPWDAWSQPPSIRVISTTEYENELLAQQTTDANTANHWDTALKLLGFVKPEVDLDSATIETQVSSIIAYYSLKNKNVTIIDHGDTYNEYQAFISLAHELVHAIQDRYRELEIINTEKTADALFARRSIIEGEAVLYSNLVGLHAKKQSFNDVDWNEYYSQMLSKAQSLVFESIHPLYFALYNLCYPLGGRFITDAYGFGGPPATKQLFTKFPSSALAIMSGYHADVPIYTMPCQATTPNDYTQKGLDEFGPMGVFAILAIENNSIEQADELSRQWRGDRVSVFRNDDNVIVVWRIRFSSSAMASTFISRINTASAFLTESENNEVIIARATDINILYNWNAIACE